MKESLGKVLFVDEAYGLMPHENHMYGKEALTELTGFVDAHQGEIMLIFAGYEDMLRNGVFAAQKGRGSPYTCDAKGTARRSSFKCFSSKYEREASG